MAFAAVNVIGVAAAVVLVSFTAVSSAGPAAPFPRGKTLVYDYYGDVKAGIIEPAAYASQFALQGTLYVKHHDDDAALKNAYHVVLSNVTTGMHNGIAAHYQRTNTLEPIEGLATKIHDPFLIIYDDNGRFEGVKFSPAEVPWAKNMKMAIASMLQLDMANIKFETPIKPHSFASMENTIHGPCWITYDVHPDYRVHHRRRPDNYKFVVTKFSSPMNCSGFAVHSYNHVQHDKCQANAEEPVNVASRRVFDIEKKGEEIVIDKLVAHGGSNYFPWNARSEAHYVLTNTTFKLDRVVAASEIDLPSVDFESWPITRELTYTKPQGNYARDAAVDITQGRRVVDLAKIEDEIEKRLNAIVYHLKKPHLDVKVLKSSFDRRSINLLREAMSYADIDVLHHVFRHYKGARTRGFIERKKIFLEVLSQVGTTASTLLTLRIILDKEISSSESMRMLGKVAMSVRAPSVDLLKQMEPLANLGDSSSISVRKAGILSFASMVHRTFKNLQQPVDDQGPLVQRYIQHFFNLLKNDNDYEMKIVYLMALKNIRIGKIYQVLDPVIRGDLEISEKPEHIRLMAIWAIDKAIEEDYEYARDLLWPIMAENNISVKLRIAAYEILMHQAPSMTDVLRIYWFMVYERNEHLYNYHHTTLKSIANSVDPCKNKLGELARKIIRFTRVHETIRNTLSSAYTVDYNDEMYNHAEKLETGMIVNELTGVPEVLQFDNIIIDARKPFSNLAMRLHIRGFDEIKNFIMSGQFNILEGRLKDSKVLDILKKAAQGLPLSKKIDIDFVISKGGQVILANHYNERTVSLLFDEIKSQVLEPKSDLNILTRQIVYHRLYEKQVTSDMGLPVVFENRIPFLAAFDIDYYSSSSSSGSSKAKTFNLDVVGKFSRHGDYSISIYNTMSDTWHAIRRSTAIDVDLPLSIESTYDSDKNNLKLSWTLSNRWSAGLIALSKDVVTVTGNINDRPILRNFCPSCNLTEDVTVVGGEYRKDLETHFVDSTDTGLKFSMSLFDCQSGVTPVSITSEWYRALMSDRKNDWNNLAVGVAMAVRQTVHNMMISPRMGTCGALVTFTPSDDKFVTKIVLNLRTHYQDVDRSTNRSLHFFNSEKHNIHGTLNVLALPGNRSTRSWDLNVNLEANQGHAMNNAKIQLTRKTPGETDLKICVDAQKTYSDVPNDALKLGVTKEETNGKLTIKVGRTEGEECVRDDTVVTLTMKGQLSDEQKKAFIKDSSDGACAKDIANPLYANPKNIIPKTVDCLKEAIRSTTLRKYSINVAHKKVSKEVASRIRYFEDIIRSIFLPNMKYTLTDVEPGNLKINAEFPVEKDGAQLSVATPDYSYSLVDASFEKPRFNGFGPVPKGVSLLWQWPLDNTRFPALALFKFTRDQLKVCSVYRKMVMTGDGTSVPFTITDRWTLISGDHYDQRFAIFAKTVGDNLATRVYTKNHQLDILPTDYNSVRVILDGHAVARAHDGFLVPNDTDNWILKMTSYNNQSIVQLKNVPLVVIHGINHVALGIESKLQGKVSGLCGHLDGTYLTAISETYTLTD